MAVDSGCWGGPPLVDGSSTLPEYVVWHRCEGCAWDRSMTFSTFDGAATCVRDHVKLAARGYIKPLVAMFVTRRFVTPWQPNPDHRERIGGAHA